MKGETALWSAISPADVLSTLLIGARMTSDYALTCRRSVVLHILHNVTGPVSDDAHSYRQTSYSSSYIRIKEPRTLSGARSVLSSVKKLSRLDFEGEALQKDRAVPHIHLLRSQHTRLPLQYRLHGLGVCNICRREGKSIVQQIVSASIRVGFEIYFELFASSSDRLLLSLPRPKYFAKWHPSTVVRC